MSDATLRSAARAAAATGSVEDQARALVARLRAGTLTQERLELAAWCDHEGARAALGWPVTTGLLPSAHSMFSLDATGRTFFYELQPWARGLARWGAEACVRAGVAAAWHIVAEHEVFTDAFRPAPLAVIHARRVLVLAEDWLGCPCEVHRVAWADGWTPVGSPLLQAEARMAWLPSPAGPSSRTSDEWSSAMAGHVWAAGQEAGEPAVRDAIRKALATWALS